MKRFRAGYGAAPLHLLAITASFAIVAVAAINWLHARTHVGNILLWYLGCLLVAEFLVIPLAALLDRIAWGRAARRGAGSVYVRVPAMLSGLMLLVFLPLIAGLGTANFHSTTGIEPSDRYLVRWLLASAAMFACSGLLYAGRLARSRSRGRTSTATHGVTVGEPKSGGG
ncbi:MAG TPA: hypothetical protein VFW09_03740 [Solirubrobacteraceae bacterium]|nr:hypothetical protein [Solirubrobacteraceae bacterium]